MTETETLIGQYKAALKNLNEATIKASDPKLSISERLKRVKELDPYWQALMAIQKQVDEIN